MSWDVDLVNMLRAEIGDFEEDSYSDSRLRQILTYAAYSVNQRAKFTNAYAVNTSDISISPDPVETNDYDFSLLTVLRACCIILTGESRVKGGGAVVIKDGPSSLDNTEGGKNTLQLMKEMCQNYEQLLTTYQLCGSNNSSGYSGVGEAVLGPYSPGSFLMNWTRNEPRNRSNSW
jgi:hypothetical protein